MHQKKGKKNKFFLYSLILLVLTSTNNYNFDIRNIFTIKQVYVSGLSKEKNEMIKDEIKEITGKNIFSISSDYFLKFFVRNDTKYLSIKKNFPNKLILNFIPAKPICFIENKNNKIILGDNGKILEIVLNKDNLPIVTGSSDLKNIYYVVNLLNSSNLDYNTIKRIIFYKSGRFDIRLSNEIIIKFPIKFDREIINFSSNLLNDKNFVNSKTIDLRIKNKVIKYE